MMSQIFEEKKIKIFFSYSHLDEKIMEGLHKHLKTLIRNQVIDTWYDRKIVPGNELNSEIMLELETADIVLLLMSSNFIDSEYCYNIEMSKALELNSENKLRVIPVILKPCGWIDTPIKSLKVLPKDGRPILDSFWESNDHAYQNVYDGIKQVIDDIKKNDQYDSDKSILRLPESLSLDEILKTLKRLPSTNYIEQPQHKKIRVKDQEKLLDSISQRNFVWTVTDWGLNENGFLGSIIEHLNLDKRLNPFLFNCEDIENFSTIQNEFNIQFGMPIQKFCSLLPLLGNTMLVFNSLNKELVSDLEKLRTMEAFASSLLDFSPNLRIVFLTRYTPTFLNEKEYLKLRPLETPEVRDYIKSNHNGGDHLDRVDLIEKIYNLTSGLPSHLDQIILDLKITSIEELIESEFEPASFVKEMDSIPKSLIKTINDLMNTPHKERSFYLLKILTVLSHGELLSNLKRFNHAKPIFPSHASELVQSSLLEGQSITINLGQLSGEPANHSDLKLLKVPRQVRDYVNTLISEDDRTDILKRAAEIYLGPKWREGVIKILSLFHLKENKIYLNYENCQLISKYLLYQSVKNDVALDIERAAIVSIKLSSELYELSNFKGALNIAEDLYHFSKDIESQQLKANICKVYGESLRIHGQRDKAIELLEEAVKLDESVFTKIQKQSIFLELAKAYEASKKEKAIEYAKKIMEISSENSSGYISAQVILLKTNSSKNKLKGYRSLEKRAREKEFLILANNIATTIANDKNEIYSNRLKYFDIILKSNGDEYNKIKAIVNKTLLFIENDELEQISSHELILLEYSYTYLYYQRLETLFNKCTTAIWAYLDSKNDIISLLNLFRHSSFIWRINNDGTSEKEYFDELSKFNLEEIEFNNQNILNKEYFEKRKLAFSK